MGEGGTSERIEVASTGIFQVCASARPLLGISQASIAEEISAEKKQVIDEMLEITGAVQLAEIMGTSIANQMITAMSQQEQLSSEAELSTWHWCP